MIKKIWKNRKLFRYIIHSLYFNFHYLPFNQAIKLPILLYKPDLLSTKGKIILDCNEIKFGLIQIGFRSCSIYPNSGFVWENHGGTIIFKGVCRIGNSSFISIGEKSTVIFGEDFRNTAGLKLVSYRGIKFGTGTSIGWGVLIMDTNFHPLYDIKNKKYKRASGPIEIGNYNWFGTECKIMHSVITPERCIFGMNTVVTRNCEMKSYCVMGGNPVKILSENVLRDYEHDTEQY